jgi:hypothetical protein
MEAHAHIGNLDERTHWAFGALVELFTDPAHKQTLAEFLEGEADLQLDQDTGVIRPCYARLNRELSAAVRPSPVTLEALRRISAN